MRRLKSLPKNSPLVKRKRGRAYRRYPEYLCVFHHTEGCKCSKKEGESGMVTRKLVDRARTERASVLADVAFVHKAALHAAGKCPCHECQVKRVSGKLLRK